MNKSRFFKGLLLLLCFIGTTAYGQKETKAFKEVFNVTPETVLDINTSNTDIQFETWDKNQIEIEATIELEGATAEEAKDYFENETIEIVGNSKKITVSTGVGSTWLFKHNTDDFNKLHFDNGFKLEMDELMGTMDGLSSDSLFVALQVIDDLPPMPPVPLVNFDYEAFEKDGEKYLKKWQSEFKEGFGEEYQEKMKAWQAELEKKNKENRKKREKLLEKRAEERGERLEKRAKERAKRMEERSEERAERMLAFQERRAVAAERRNRRFQNRRHRTDSIHSLIISTSNSLPHHRPNIFYLSSDGENKNYKVKKTIKIKMPKANKIKMNVRHGEVKLAANTLNIDADLSYANLLAFEIDGEETNVRASYSPVFVEKWNLGQLRTEYSEAVNLQEVRNLRLTATSSKVTIDRLLNKALIKNDFGRLKILSVAKNFTDLDVSLQNAELDCEIPDTDFTVYVNGTSSRLTLPTTLQLERTKNGNTTIHKGFYKNKNSNRGIVINAKYSEVVLD